MGSHSRYNLEHIVLPKTMYELSEGLFGYILRERENALPLLYKMAGADPCPYPLSDFQVDSSQIRIENQDVRIIRISMPPAKSIADCRAVYLCRNAKNNQMLYFTSELSRNGDYLIHVWMTERVHICFRSAPADAELNYVVSLYKELIIDGKLKSVMQIANQSIC